MMELWEALSLGFIQRAYLAGIAAGIVCPTVGLFLVLRRQALIADGLGHASFAGVAAGMMFEIHPMAGALAVAVIGALGMERLRVSRVITGDGAIAVYSSLGLGIGVILAHMARGSGADRMMAFLFGSLAAVRPADLYLILGLGAAVVAAVLLFYKELTAVTIHEDTARAAGIPTGAMNRLLAVLTALTVVLAMRVVGVLLVTALMVLPVATALQAARGMFRALVLSVAAGAAAVIIGLSAAYLADLPAGAAVVVTSAVLFGVVTIFRQGIFRGR